MSLTAYTRWGLNTRGLVNILAVERAFISRLSAREHDFFLAPLGQTDLQEYQHENIEGGDDSCHAVLPQQLVCLQARPGLGRDDDGLHHSHGVCGLSWTHLFLGRRRVSF